MNIRYIRYIYIYKHVYIRKNGSGFLETSEHVYRVWKNEDYILAREYLSIRASILKKVSKRKKNSIKEDIFFCH